VFTDSGSRRVASRPMVRRNRTYDFSNRFEFGLNVILDPLTRSIPDNGGDHSP
jgi:hypothetical protein